jgi:hypothetical protein
MIQATGAATQLIYDLIIATIPRVESGVGMPRLGEYNTGMLPKGL